ncbi:HIT domain-containing protein [Candidatus Babeliales bacterium]|nr:HIT domain-containing protein [Candidatus Babeliales bacterium]
MDKIYAPWRQSYIENIDKKNNGSLDVKECVFCVAFQEKDNAKSFILKRTELTVTMLNVYPYIGGHLMVLPYEHKGELFELTGEVRAAIMEEVNFSIEALKKSINPHGFNVGLNLGDAGGGGIPSHLHMHVLPRWHGDTNFMPLLSNTKPVSCSIENIYEQLLPFFISKKAIK